MADIIIDVTEQIVEVVANNGAYPLPSSINSVFGRTGTVVATEGDYSLTQLSDVNLISPANGQILKYNGTNWVNTTIGDYVPYTGATSDLNLGTNNIYTNNLFEKFVSLTASGTQLVLTVSSAPSIVVSGSGGQTIKLPDATTLPNGATYYFNNNQSSGVINVNNNSNTLVKSAQSGSYLIITLLDNSIAAGSWDAHFEAPSNASWSTNTFDYAGSITNATWNGTTIAINRGGTGATTAGAALTNLGGIGLTSLSATTPLSYNNTTGVFTISQASASANGYLASGDFNTFNGKQNALTNPITGTGTTNTLPKFTGSTAIGDSNITDNGTLISLGSNTTISSGGLGIGTSTLTGYILNVAKNITGATTSYGIRSQGTVQSDVTTLVSNYGSLLNTAAASFTLTDYVHHRSMQGTIGASSVVTNQYGYYADSSMIGATNNYGFYGGIASGTNRWNLYMQGTAANYMAGVLNIGSTTLSGFQLDVTGTSRLNGQTTITGSITASSAIARGTNITSTLVASANSDVLVALDINPTFTNGAFTGVLNFGLRTSSFIKSANFNTQTTDSVGASYITSIGYNVIPSVTGKYNIGIGGLNDGNGNTTGQRLTSGTNNILIGHGCGIFITTGTNNISLGYNALNGNSGTQASNIAIGSESLNLNTGSANTAIGLLSGLNVSSGSNNVFLGYYAGRFQANGSTALALTGNNNIYIGSNAKGFNNSDTNIIVIGSSAIGLGSNTTIIGNSSTTITGLFGNLRLASGMGTAPASATATGTTGDIVVTATYIYVCSATNTWVRTALSTW